MKYQLLKNIRKFSVLFLVTCLCVFTSCKKDSSTEVIIDAFAQVDNEVKYDQGVYNLLFSLQEYPYKEVGIRIGISKSLFHQDKDLTNYTANMVAANRYGVFLNSLMASKIYYYQIYVKDSKSEKVVYSDVFSFKTNP